MQTLLVIVHVIICLILILVILLQAGRGQGLAGASFSGGGVQSLLGTRTADFLTKATTTAAILFLFTCIGLDLMEAQKSRSLFDAQRPVAPVDVQQIQEALDKIKAEQARQAGPPATASQSESKAAPSTTPLPESASTAKPKD